MAVSYLLTSQDNVPVNGAPAGTFFIGDRSADDLPVTDPLNNTSRVKFHSGLDYLGIKAIWTSVGGVNGAPITTGTTGTRTMMSHGLGFRPLLMADLLFNTSQGPVLVPWKGSLIQFLLAPGFIYRRLELSADATSVYVSEWTTFAGAQQIDWFIYLLDRGFQQDPAGNEAFNLDFQNADQIRASQGRFDTAKGYLRTDPGAQTPRTFSGQTMEVRNRVEVGINTIEGTYDIAGSGIPWTNYTGFAPSSPFFSAAFDLATF